MRKRLFPLMASLVLAFLSAAGNSARAQAGDAKEVERLKQKLHEVLKKPLDSRADGSTADGLACALARHDAVESGQALRRLLLCNAPGGGGTWIWFSFSRYRKEFPQRAARELIPLLQDREAEVRRRAALELARLDLGHEKEIAPILPVVAAESKELIQALQANLKDKDEVVRWASAEALLATRSPAAKVVPPLVLEWLKEMPPPRVEELTALPFHGGGRDAFGANWGGRILARAPDRTLDHILDALPTASHAGRERLFLVARQLLHARDVDKDRLAAVFARGLEEKEARIRILAIESLQQLGKAALAARAALEKRLEDPVSDVRLRAIAALVALDRANPGPVVAPLKELLNSPDMGTTDQALAVAARLGKAARPLAPQLQAIVEDARSPHRLAAARALLLVDDMATGTALKALADVVPKMKPAAAPPAELIRLLGPAAKPALPELLNAFKRSKQTRRAAWAVALAFVDASPRGEARTYVREKLLEGKLDDDLYFQLTNLGTDARLFLPELHAVLKTSSDGEVLVETLEVVAVIGADAKELLPTLTPLLKHKAPMVREAAARAAKSVQGD